MLKTKNLDRAKAYAATHNQAVGLCVFDGFYYTGSPEQLERIGACPTMVPGASPPKAPKGWSSTATPK